MTPMLTPDDQANLLGRVDWTCNECGRRPYKNYCRQCDEFFYECGCTPEPGSRDDHRGHRTY